MKSILSNAKETALLLVSMLAFFAIARYVMIDHHEIFGVIVVAGVLYANFGKRE